MQESRDSNNVTTAGGRIRSRMLSLREHSTERSRSRTPAAQKRDTTKNHSQSRHRSVSSVRIQEQPAWTRHVKRKTKKEPQTPKEVMRSASPENGSQAHLEALLMEGMELRKKVRHRKATNANLKRVELEASTQTPEVVEPVAAREGLTKAKRKVPLPEEESDWEASKGETQLRKMLEELLRISRKNKKVQSFWYKKQRY
ncbi:hypothetical protein MRX96_045175 [Rhipicephalus microplus]